MCCVQVQGIVCELRAGFSRALLELNQIQQGDTELQSQLEDTRHGCNKRALHLESLVLSLKVRSHTCLVNLFCSLCVSYVFVSVSLGGAGGGTLSVSSTLWGTRQKTTRESRNREVNTQTHADMHKCKVWLKRYYSACVNVCVCECSNGVDDSSGQSNGAAEAPPLSPVGGDFLIHCYLQGLQVWQWARQNTGELSFFG